MRGNHGKYLLSFVLITIFSGIFVFFHGHSFSQPDRNLFFSSVHIVEMVGWLIVNVSFFVLFATENALLKSFYRGVTVAEAGDEKRGNQFYCLLMLAVVHIILFGTFHFLNYDADKDSALEVVKVWETCAYGVTTIYTIWFWNSKSANGPAVIEKLRNKKIYITQSIWLGISLLGILSFAHTCILFGGAFLLDNIYKPIQANASVGSTFLIALTYLVFVSINRKVIRDDAGDEFVQDFKNMHRYIDRPLLIVFGFLFVYASYTAFGTDKLHSVELFFSGAIAFELLLSSIVWANTETA